MDEMQRSKADSGAVAREADLEPTYTDKAGNVYKKRILTGDRTTGKLHLGHYVGSLRNRVKYQSVYDTFILMADIQALTTHWDKPEINKQSVMHVALDYMAIGLNPYTGGPDDQTRAKIVVQSHVPSIAELTVLYGLVTPMSIVLDNPTTKAEAQQYGMGAASEEDQAGDIPVDMFRGYPAELLVHVAEVLREEYPELGEIEPEVVAAGLNSADKELTVSHKKELTDKGYAESFGAIDIERFHEVLLSSAAIRRHVRDHIIRRQRQTGVRQMSYGFLGYPVSQAADITFVNARSARTRYPTSS